MDYEPGRPEVYDFRQHDRLWQRVQPGLEPYPEAAPPRQDAGEAPQALPPAGLSVTQEGSLPGAEPDPCCMGTEAAELLAVLEGYIGEEAEERRRYPWHCPGRRRSGRGSPCGNWQRTRPGTSGG